MITTDNDDNDILMIIVNMIAKHRHNTRDIGLRKP